MRTSSTSFSRVNVGAKVVVLPKNAPLMAEGTGGDSVRKRSGRDDAALGPAGAEPDRRRR